MIVVAAKLKAVSGKGNEIEQAFRKLIPTFLKEPGTVSYTLHRKVDAPDEFLVYEKYENGEAFKAHISTEHFKEFSKALAPLQEGRADIGIYQEIA